MATPFSRYVPSMSDPHALTHAPILPSLVDSLIRDPFDVALTSHQ